MIKRKGNNKMRSKIITIMLLAAFCTASIVSCGTVENVSETSSVIGSGESSAADDSLQPVTEESAESTTDTTTSTEPASTETTTTVTEAATEKEVSAENGYVADPGETPAANTPAETPAETPEPQTEAPTEAPAVAPAGSFNHDDMTFLYGNAQATVLVDASGLIAALGTPSNVEEAPSCLSNGCDVKNYYYSGITVYTYIDGGREIIYEIELTSPSFTTAKGLAPGMTVADAEALYGTNYTSGGGVISYYDSGNTYMYLIVSGDTITSIGYAAEV